MPTPGYNPSEDGLFPVREEATPKKDQFLEKLKELNLEIRDLIKLKELSLEIGDLIKKESQKNQVDEEENPEQKELLKG